MSKPIASHLFTAFFWIFNAALLLILYFVCLLLLGPAMFRDIAAGQVPINVILPFFGLVGVPTACSVASALPKQRQKISLVYLFYGVEAPLLLVCLSRFFWLRDLTAGSSILLLTGVIGAVIFAHWLTQGQEPESVNGWHLGGLTLLLAIALYLSALASFYVIPTAMLVLAILIPAVVYSVIVFPFAALLIGVCTMPFGLLVVSLRAWWQVINTLEVRWGKLLPRALAATVLGVWLLTYNVVQYQPQDKAFALLSQPPQTDGDRQELVNQSAVIRRGLLNAYLARYRYPLFDDSHIYNIYRSLQFPESVATTLQTVYTGLVTPFVYGGTPADQDQAASLYAQFFDTPILRGEKAAIQKAIQSTFNRDEAKAGLLDVNEQRVWLANQELTLTPQGDWAEVELYEVYRNQTYDQQEILYYFSLPESAVITGLWLGDTSDRTNRFTYAIAPRGAAQQVYTEEVNRRVDPALLEQVGPQTYRLRAFPVPAQGNGELHLWLTYKTLQQEGRWPLPQLHEQRNIYWTPATRRVVNGTSRSGSDQWLSPDFLASATAASPVEHQLTLPWGAQVLATPLRADSYQLPKNQRFAVVLDRSYSMNAHRDEVVKTLQWIGDRLLTENAADLYLTTAAPGQPKRFDNMQDVDLTRPVFFGSLQPREMLQQFLQLKGETPYDAVLVITDAGSYELTADQATALEMPAPLWMVHLGGLQAAYDDATTQAIQDSGGGVATTLPAVMQRIGTQPTRGAGTSLLNVVDGYAWFLTQQTGAPSDDAAFTPLAARQWVRHLSRYLKPDDVKTLDVIHQISQDYGMVTPYSSMIVLVNDEQRARLRELEQQSDRFQRSVEDQQLPQPTYLTTPVSAVPEPAEWLLLLLAVLMLAGLYGWQTQRAHQSSLTPD